jgi:hypothetical protein
LGSDAETGVAGLTLGGGFGYLTRCFGTSSDNLEEVEVVTADGVIRRAAADENEDLFWAVRGGGGNFGVITRFTFRLHQVGPQVTGGLIVWDAEQAGDVISLYRQLAGAAPRQLSLTLIMRPAPPAPFIPGIWHGRPVIAVLACHTGDASQGRHGPGAAAGGRPPDRGHDHAEELPRAAGNVDPHAGLPQGHASLLEV